MWRWKGPQRSVSLETGKLQLLPTPPPPPPCPEGAREEIFQVLQSTWSPPTMQLYQSHKSCHRGHIKNEYCHVPMTPCWWTPMFEFHKIFTCHKILGFPTAPPQQFQSVKTILNSWAMKTRQWADLAVGLSSTVPDLAHPYLMQESLCDIFHSLFLNMEGPGSGCFSFLLLNSIKA